VIKENLWWDGKENQKTFRSSLIKVDGFSGPDEFENFVNQANMDSNLLLKKRDIKRFNSKYSLAAKVRNKEMDDESFFVKQT